MSSPLTAPGEPGATAETIAAVVRGCPGVARLDGGGLVQVATYLPGRRVDGVRVEDDRVTIALTAQLGRSLPGVADRVRVAVTPHTDGRPVDVRITDVELPAPTAP